MFKQISKFLKLILCLYFACKGKLSESIPFRIHFQFYTKTCLHQVYIQTYSKFNHLFQSLEEIANQNQSLFFYLNFLSLSYDIEQKKNVVLFTTKPKTKREKKKI